MSEPAHANVVPFRRPPCDPRTGEVLEDVQAFIDKLVRKNGELQEFYEAERDEKVNAKRLNKSLRTELNKAKEDAAEEATEDPDLVRRLVTFHYSQTAPGRVVKEPILLSAANAVYIRWLLQRCDYTAREIALMSVGMAGNSYYQSKNLVSIQQMTTTKAAPPGRQTEIRMFDDEKVNRFLDAGKKLKGEA